jgi:diguanylate cyclase (GGDEF)-like protein
MKTTSSGQIERLNMNDRQKNRTEQKATGVQGSMSNGLLLAFPENSPDVIVFALGKNNGYHSLLSCGLDIWVNQKDCDRLVVELKEYGELCGFETQLRRKDGSIFKGILSARIIEINQENYALCFLRDITEHKLAVEALQKALEDKNRLLKELEEKNKILQEISITDGLTGLYNRRFIMKNMLDHIEKATRYQYIFSIIIFDLDNFKEINDTYGHLVGDEVLQRISLELKNNLRKTDIIGRYGGEEFIVILPYADQIAAYHIAEKVRKSIQELQWDKYFFTITLSGGVVRYNGGSIESLIEKTDKSLYRAKDNGRNRIEVDNIFQLEIDDGKIC